MVNMSVWKTLSYACGIPSRESLYREKNFDISECLSGKESACQCRKHGFDPWFGKISWRRKWQPTSAFLPGKSHGQRSLMGYRPWGHKRVSRTWLGDQGTERMPCEGGWLAVRAEGKQKQEMVVRWKLRVSSRRRCGWLCSMWWDVK